MLCFAISSVFGREFVARSDRAKGFDRYMEEHGAMMIFVLRLIPLVSFDALSYAAGLTGIPFRKFLLATALGSAPSLSSTLARPRRDQAFMRLSAAWPSWLPWPTSTSCTISGLVASKAS